MENILQKIIDVKRNEVARDSEIHPLSELKSQLKDLPPCRDFHHALTKENPRGINVIAEIKRASPSAGLIRADFDPITIARTYYECTADALSVLTDETFFQGSLDYIVQVRDVVPLPVLRKDFTIDPYQVYQARTAHADAILLIAEALSEDDMLSLIILSEELGLTTLIEVHETDSLLKVLQILQDLDQSRCLLGINNRNLKTMQVDLNQSFTLRNHIGPHLPVISESGIKIRPHVEQLLQADFHGILIGETLMRHPDIADKFRELFG